MNVEKVRKTLLLARQKIQSHLNEIYDSGGVEYIGLGSTLDEIDRVVKELDSEGAKNTKQANQPTRTGNQGAIGGCMDAEKSFWQFWEKRWSFTSSNEKVLSLSANFRNTKEAFLAGWEASGNTEQANQPDKKENTWT